MSRLFWDANVIFTAVHNPEGLAAALLARQKTLKLAIRSSPYAINEAQYNLQLKSPDSVHRLKNIVRQIEIIEVPLVEGENPLALPNADLPIFQGALSSKSTHLITGDKKAFGKWMNKPDKTFGLMIQTARHFADSLAKK